MTVNEYAECIVSNQWREKLISKLCAEFPDHVRYAEDVAQGFLARIKPEKFGSAGELGKYLFDNVGHRMQNVIKKEKGRRKAARTVTITSRPPKRYDPMKQIDWKVDLERAICAVVPAGPMRAAMWHHVYEGYEIQEVADMLVSKYPERTHDGWRGMIDRAKVKLDSEMRRKHYKGV